MINPLKHTRMAANGTIVISDKATNLGSVIINTAGASSNILTIYNGLVAAGDIVAIIDTTSANLPERDYFTSMPAGITVVMGTGTAADITITHG